MKTFFSCILLFISCSLCAQTVKDRFSKSVPGDFVVFVHDKYMTLLRIDECKNDVLVIEEITAPSSALKLIGGKWQKWLSDNAPENTSWTMTKISLKTCSVAYIYSFTNNKLYPQESAISFLPTLLAQTLVPISPESRKLSGPQPQEGEVDFRKAWNPKIIFDGKIVDGTVGAYSIVWPKDDTELSGKNVDLYFPENAGLTYFPYWVELHGKFTKVKFFVVDSGKNLSTDKKVP